VGGLSAVLPIGASVNTANRRQRGAVPARRRARFFAARHRVATPREDPGVDQRAAWSRPSARGACRQRSGRRRAGTRGGDDHRAGAAREPSALLGLGRGRSDRPASTRSPERPLPSSTTRASRRARPSARATRSPRSRMRSSIFPLARFSSSPTRTASSSATARTSIGKRPAAARRPGALPRTRRTRSADAGVASTAARSLTVAARDPPAAPRRRLTAGGG